MNEDDYNLTRLARTLGPKGHRNITFESLAKHPDWYVREALAKNPNTPANVLNLLAYDEDTYVRQAVLDNPNATPEMVDYILKHTKISDTLFICTIYFDDMNLAYIDEDIEGREAETIFPEICAIINDTAYELELRVASCTVDTLDDSVDNYNYGVGLKIYFDGLLNFDDSNDFIAGLEEKLTHAGYELSDWYDWEEY